MAKPHIVTSVEVLVKLWIHETSRVFHDRLISDEDRYWFKDTIQKQLFINFNLDWKKVTSLKDILFNSLLELSFIYPGLLSKF